MTTISDQVRRRGDRDRPLEVGRFRWLLAGVAVNNVGNGIAPVALAFAVVDLGGEAVELGLVVGAYALANVVAVLLGGVAGDRLPRGRMMVASSAAAAAAQGLVALALIGGSATLGLLAGLGALNGALGAVGQPSSQAVTRDTVPAHLLAAAVAWRRLIQNAALIVGMGSAGVLVAAVGSGWALAVDAATFALAAGCFARLRLSRAPVKAPVPAAAGLLGDVRAGAAEVARHTWLWALILQALLYHLFYGGAQGVLGPLLVGETLGRPAWGWALAAMMTGFVGGGMVTLRWRPRRLLLSGVACLALTACFPLAIALDSGLAVLLAGAFLHGLGLEIFSVGWDLAIQQNVDPGALARVYAFDQVGSFIARPLGLAATGPVAELVGYRAWLVVVAVVIVLASAAALLVPDVRRLERRNGHAPTA